MLLSLSILSLYLQSLNFGYSINESVEIFDTINKDLNRVCIYSNILTYPNTVVAVNGTICLSRTCTYDIIYRVIFYSILVLVFKTLFCKKMIGLSS